MKKGRRNTAPDAQNPPSPDPPPSPSSPSPLTVPMPPIEWEEEAQYLGPTLRYNSLPLVVTCDRRGLPSMEHVNFDFSQPLLLHTLRTVRKVVASNVMHVTPPGGAPTRLREVGDHLLIPEDYRGRWLFILFF